ncbi:MAG: hypothetical protein Ct9H300mP28_22820 [Pseudomonadota bacterium]|nr:MAG: hypothetical protein Ct9H300mP28_22820 [Pseudomonadota bacterium]
MMEKLKKSVFILIEPSPKNFPRTHKHTKQVLKKTRQICILLTKAALGLLVQIGWNNVCDEFFEGICHCISENPTMYPPKIAPSGWPFLLQLQRQKLEAVNENKLSV